MLSGIGRPIRILGKVSSGHCHGFLVFGNFKLDTPYGSRLIGPIRAVLHIADAVERRSVITVQFIFQIAQLSLNRRGIVSVLSAIIIQPCPALIMPLADSVTCAVIAQSVRVKRGFRLDIRHDAAGGGVIQAHNVRQIAVNGFLVGRACHGQQRGEVIIGEKQSHIGSVPKQVNPAVKTVQCLIP